MGSRLHSFRSVKDYESYVASLERRIADSQHVIETYDLRNKELERVLQAAGLALADSNRKLREARSDLEGKNRHINELMDKGVGMHRWLCDIAEAVSDTRLRTLNDLAPDVASLRSDLEAAREGHSNEDTEHTVWRARALDAEAGLTKWHDAWLKSEAEVERLRKENEDMRSQVGPVATQNRELLNKVERLRAALENMLGDDDRGDPYVFEHMGDMERYVRNALTEEKE